MRGANVIAGVIGGLILLPSFSMYAAAGHEPGIIVDRCAPLHLYGDGVHDDSAALRAWAEGKPVLWADTGHPVGPTIFGPGSAGRTFLLGDSSYPLFPPGWSGQAAVNDDWRSDTWNIDVAGDGRRIQAPMKCTRACHAAPAKAPPERRDTRPSECLTS